MTTYHVRIMSGKKGTGTKHAAYITRRGAHGDKEDLVHTSFGNLPDWAGGDPAQLWRSADQHERSNGAVYRELVIALPNELNGEQNIMLAEKLVHHVLGPKPFEYAIHAPEGSLGGVLNPHLHVMYSDRIPDGIQRLAEKHFARYNAAQPKLGGCRKDSGGKTRLQLRDEVIAMRKKVADILNQALAENGVDARVDHRSLRAQGKRHRPERHQGPARVRGMSEEQKAEYRSKRQQDREDQ